MSSYVFRVQHTQANSAYQVLSVTPTAFTCLLLTSLPDIDVLFTFTFSDNAAGLAWNQITKGLTGRSAALQYSQASRYH
ncbi:hypothetical protein Cadr_000008977 [Camelus dromedarius]|uniref:Uncharacterized protein n=1 Tax=Camelus dromedarius TaxID=9838 RepID=A0A5N4DKU7_CAMDR|nr:hypothetical protein Cadr_000008977 [Camelus dromedarius]